MLGRTLSLPMTPCVAYLMRARYRRSRGSAIRYGPREPGGGRFKFLLSTESRFVMSYVGRHLAFVIGEPAHAYLYIWLCW